MSQILHGSATTTEAIRRAIQHSQESLRALSKRYGVNQKTIAKWKARTSVADRPTGPKEPKSTVLSLEDRSSSPFGGTHADSDAGTSESDAVSLPAVRRGSRRAAAVEGIRWPNGPSCPHCGVVNEATELKGKATRPGVYKCNACKKQFTATVGTVYERSHIPLHKWLLATRLLCSSKKGMSAHQLWRMLGFGSYKTAWFLAHRIREGMRDDSHLPEGGFGGANKVVEADETYIGGKAK